MHHCNNSDNHSDKPSDKNLSNKNLSNKNLSSPSKNSKPSCHCSNQADCSNQANYPNQADNSRDSQALNAMPMFDVLVFIGRFQPFHWGHKAVVDQAFMLASHVVVLIGSANRPRSIKNPFSFDERKAVIEQTCPPPTGKQLTCLPVDDVLYNDALWLQKVQQALAKICNFTQNSGIKNIAIIGHNKDDSSYYLRLFPQWAYYEMDNIANLSATPIRRAYFDETFNPDCLLGNGVLDNDLLNNGLLNNVGIDDNINASDIRLNNLNTSNLNTGNPNTGNLNVDGVSLSALLPPASLALMKNFYHTPAYQALVAEQRYLRDYLALFDNLPYPPIFQTADSLVVQAGHILVVRRGGEYGKGLLALPGGFVNSNETLQACAVRELKEETGLDIGAIRPKEQRTFDKPDRSPRGRTITTVFLYQLTGDKLPALTAGDDAETAFWLPLGALDGKLFFEDHYGIVCCLLGLS